MPAALPQYLQRPDFIAAMQAGSSAGNAQGQDALEAAKLQENARQADQGNQLQYAELAAQQNQAQARIAQSQANAAMDQEQHAADMAIKQDMFQQTQLREQVKSDMEKARGDALIGIQQSRLDQEAKKLEATATAVARKYSNQQKVQQRRAELVASGMPIEQAAMIANLENPDTSPSGAAAISNAMRPRQATAKRYIQVGADNKEGYEEGTYEITPDRQFIRVGPPSRKSEGSLLEQLLSGGSLPQAGGGAPQPAPTDPKQRKADTIYTTPKGPLKWTGTGWTQP